MAVPSGCIHACTQPRQSLPLARTGLSPAASCVRHGHALSATQTMHVSNSDNARACTQPMNATSAATHAVDIGRGRQQAKPLKPGSWGLCTVSRTTPNITSMAALSRTRWRDTAGVACARDPTQLRQHTPDVKTTQGMFLPRTQPNRMTAKNARKDTQLHTHPTHFIQCARHGDIAATQHRRLQRDTAQTNKGHSTAQHEPLHTT